MSTGSFLRRAVWATTSATFSAGGLVVFFAWLALNAQWHVPEPEELTGPTTITARDGTVLARFDSEVDRRIVPLAAVSQAAIDAVVAAEDARFFEHEGVDVTALMRAVAMNVRTGSIQQGGSTLTQQYVKNAFVGQERTLTRKIREAVISIQLERERSKEDILEEYLNTVYFGEGAHGIEAAALTYFGVPAAELDLAQGATLAQILPAPSSRNPRVDPSGARLRRNALISRMVELGMVSQREGQAARREPMEVKEREPRRFEQPYFVAHVRQVLERAYGPEAVLTGALTVRTTLDLTAQQRLDEAVRDNGAPAESGFEQAAIAVDPSSGDVLAMHGGRDFYGDTSAYSRSNYAQVNLATQGARQPGSTFKPFVLIAAMEQGISAAARYPAPAQVTIGDWSPRNADGRGYGRLSLAEAMVDSVNTVYAQLGIDVGPEAVTEVARRMGIQRPIETDVTVALGATARGPSVLDMASAFATLANDGLACPARTVLEVRDRDGAPVEIPEERPPGEVMLTSRPEELQASDDGRCYQAIDREIARAVNAILQDVVERGTGRRARLERPTAGKTGTTQDNNDAWFVGYTPDLALGVWMGDPDERRPLRDIRGHRSVFGGTVPAIIWRAAAARLLEDVPPRAFPEPGLVAGERRPGPAMSRSRGDAGGGRSAGPSPSPTDDVDPGDDDPPGGSDPGPSPSPDEPDDEDGGDDGGACVPPLITSGCD